ncbi:uncharacterized protein EI90DRAFT_1856131 [Cantharellus anzutake]|uniref:uncharacterized protein n=1 Tax=Cantharellus anzutake TaxID=1750568 RepID=UPI001905CBC7|nr:uncharacterized protein EI90DRAFT_1856131 [Cantharellus anzutake]KAF8326999.1 hypothetical protein EI90DRAFT_1856131 [Cantharellus anzutake]
MRFWNALVLITLLPIAIVADFHLGIGAWTEHIGSFTGAGKASLHWVFLPSDHDGCRQANHLGSDFPMVSLGSPLIVTLCGVVITVPDELGHWNSSDGESGYCYPTADGISN